MGQSRGSSLGSDISGWHHMTIEPKKLTDVELEKITTAWAPILGHEVNQLLAHIEWQRQEIEHLRDAYDDLSRRAGWSE